MGGDTLLIVPGRWEKGQSYFSTYNKILEKVKKISYIASDMGITIGLENTQSCFLLSPKEWAEFIDEVNSPNIKFYFDIGNVYYVGLGEPSDWIRDLGYRICRIHLKDCLIKKEGLSITRNIVELGMGNIDWKCVKKSLEDIKYNSWFTVELTLPDKNRKEFLKRNSLFIEMVFG
jgi:hexulose-6-phosphate isomerase